MASNTKTSPGVVRMKAFIWEPHPIVQRQKQDVTMVHSAETLAILPDSKKVNIEPFAGNPPSIYLKPKYAYKSTFLFQNNAHIQTPQILSNFFPDLDINPDPDKPGVPHQSFKHIGSLFSDTNPDAVDPSQTTTTAPQLGRAQWEYDIVQKTIETDFVQNQQASGVSLDTMLEEAIPTDPNDPASKTATTRTISIMMPYQVASSQLPFVSATAPQTTNGTGTSTNSSGDATDNGSNPSATTPSTADNPSIRSVHWRAKKITSLFQGEDIVVEFHRRSYRPDAISPYYMNGVNYLSDYRFIDPNLGVQNGAIVNRGVITLDDDGNVIESSRTEYDLRIQPYYLIELGDASSADRYFIIIAGNSPRFIHVGSINVEQFDSDGNLTVAPLQSSRCLSVYDGVSSKTLLDLERLRITVRNHLGKMVVIFGGYENQPWIIERNDLMPKDAPPPGADASSDPADFVYDVVPIVTPESTMSICAGNMLCGFLFTPLHYEAGHDFTVPQVIAVRGPVSESDINLYLRENATRPLGQSASVSQLYFQDAELFIEIKAGSETRTPKVRAQTQTEQQYNKAPDKHVTSGGGDPPSADGQKVSFLKVYPRTSLPSDANKPGNSVDDNSQYVSYMYVGYAMGAGDYKFPEVDAEDFLPGADVGASEYTLYNCMTPISTGWRLSVPAGGGTTNDGTTATDVSHHTVGYSSQWQYTEAQRCDHNGSIRFWIYPDVPWGVDRDGNLLLDQSEFLASLNDKTFFIRIYAWWDGGYMAVDGCDGNSFERCALFTGLCHGGEITTECGQRYMDCQLLDYWKVLSDQQFLNCPFFDGLRDYNAVDEILGLAGFRGGDEGSSGGTVQVGVVGSGTGNSDPWAPRGLIKTLANVQRGGAFVMPYNGETIYAQEYALPSSYDILQAPILKFADQSNMDEAITQIARISGKVAYFDRFGIFHLDIRPDIAYQLRAAGSKAHFYATPRDLARCPSGSRGFNQLVLNSYSWKRATADVVNEIQLVSTTPEGALIIGNATNFASKFDPTSSGFVGYTKRLLQMDGIFGSQAAVQSAVSYYKGFFTPPILVNFESYGTSKLKAMDIIQFTGVDLDTSFPSNLNGAGSRTVNLIITSLSHEINPKDNKWISKFECEWIFTGAIN